MSTPKKVAVLRQAESVISSLAAVSSISKGRHQFYKSSGASQKVDFLSDSSDFSSDDSDDDRVLGKRIAPS